MYQEELFLIQFEQGRRRNALLPIAKKLAKFLPNQSEGSLLKTLDDMSFSTSRDFEPAIEDGSIASAHLLGVAEAADTLIKAIDTLGIGALMVLSQSTSLKVLKAEADLHQLPVAEDTALGGSNENLRMLHCEGEWKDYLHALAEAARQASGSVQSMIQRGGPKVFQRSLADTEQRQIIRACLKRLRDWGAPEKLALPMARAIHEAHTGQKSGPRWGESVLPKLL